MSEAEQEEYRVGRVRPNYDSTINRFGKVIHVHRPVLPNNYKSPEGWQFSYKGVPFSTFKVEPDTRHKAILMFDEMSQMLGQNWNSKFDQVYNKNKTLFRS